MVLLVLAFLGGILTIVSPCILPVLPFVFARADQPFRKSGLPLLAGMALTFAAFAAIATVGGAWVVRANQYGRIAALVVLAVFGLTLLWPALADRLSRPFVQLGSQLSRTRRIPDASPSPLRSLLLGVATGLLWAPCAGPILGLILTGAALEGASSSQCFSAAGLRRGRRDFASRRTAGGRTGVRRAQALLGSGSLDTQRPGRCSSWRAWWSSRSAWTAAC